MERYDVMAMCSYLVAYLVMAPCRQERGNGVCRIELNATKITSYSCHIRYRSR